MYGKHPAYPWSTGLTAATPSGPCPQVPHPTPGTLGPPIYLRNPICPRDPKGGGETEGRRGRATAVAFRRSFCVAAYHDPAGLFIATTG
jgi:hypothetical protein